MKKYSRAKNLDNARAACTMMLAMNTAMLLRWTLTNATSTKKRVNHYMMNYTERINNMKDFDYNAAKAGAPVCTRSGRPARIICWDANAKWEDDIFPIVALIDYDVNGEVIQTYTTDGRMYTKKTDDYDLMMATTKREGWINIYKRLGRIITGDCVWNTEDEAKSAVVKEDYITTIKIEWEE